MNYGRGESGRNYYGGGVLLSPHYIATVPIAIEVFDQNGTRKDYFQTGSTDLIEVEFGHSEAGCNDFSLKFGGLKNITKNDKIKIKIFSSDLYFFSGVVREIPIEGSTQSNYTYSGFGFNDYFQRYLSGNKSYTNKSVSYIVKDLLSILTAATAITQNIDKISSALDLITISAASFYYISLYDAFDALRKIANSDGNDYILGIDETNDFFFMPRSTDLKATLIVGKTGRYGIPSYDPKDSYEAKTKYYIVRDDGTFYGSVASLEDNDTFEEKIQAPEGLSDADIANWAAGILKENEVNQRSAQITWKIEDYYPDLIKADGYIRVISNVQQHAGEDITPLVYGTGDYGEGIYGGEQYTGYIIDDTLKIVDVKYQITPNGATRKITLGALPVMLESQIINVRKKLVELTINLGR